MRKIKEIYRKMKPWQVWLLAGLILAVVGGLLDFPAALVGACAYHCMAESLVVWNDCEDDSPPPVPEDYSDPRS